MHSQQRFFVACYMAVSVWQFVGAALGLSDDAPHPHVMAFVMLSLHVFCVIAWQPICQEYISGSFGNTQKARRNMAYAFV